MSKFLNDVSINGSLTLTGNLSTNQVTATQFNYLSGATSNIQNQINNLTANTTGKLLSTLSEVSACTDSSYFASATAVKELNNNLEFISYNPVDSHNGYYISKDITSFYEDGTLWDRIAGKNGFTGMEGIYPGCYFDMSRGIRANVPENPYLPNGVKRIVVLGCNSKWFKSGNNQDTLNFNHIVCTPKTNLGVSYFNTENNGNGYYGSYMNQSVIGLPTTTGNIAGTINEQLYAEFGGHLITYKQKLSNNVDSTTLNNNLAGWYNRSNNQNLLGSVTDSVTAQVQSLLFSSNEIIGSSIENASFIYATTGIFPAFIYHQGLVSDDFDFWLRDIPSYLRGYEIFRENFINTRELSKSGGVRPYFILGTKP